METDIQGFPSFPIQDGGNPQRAAQNSDRDYNPISRSRQIKSGLGESGAEPSLRPADGRIPNRAAQQAAMAKSPQSRSAGCDGQKVATLAPLQIGEHTKWDDSFNPHPRWGLPPHGFLSSAQTAPELEKQAICRRPPSPSPPKTRQRTPFLLAPRFTQGGEGGERERESQGR